MYERSRITTSCLVGVTAAVLLLVLPVEAQVPSPSSPVVQPQETVKLTMEQKHIIKEIIIKDMKTPGASTHVDLEPGKVVPKEVTLQPMPVEVSAKVPQVRTHSYFVEDDKVVIVDAKDNKVAALVE